jgi:hypothetical protein
LIVHFRINDAATQQPTPVRLRISGPDGTTYPPLGQPAEFALGRYEDVGGKVCLGRRRWWSCAGACELNLPTGVPLLVEALKGLEYRPLRQTVTLGAGQLTLRFTLERGLDAPGWYSGDGRVHARSPHAAALDGAAEGLHFVNLLARQVSLPSHDGQQYYSTPELSAFSGQSPALEQHGCTVVGNTLNTHLVLGSLALWHCHRPVFPLHFGPPDATDDWGLSDWADQCHRKRGLVVWSDWQRTLTHHAGGAALPALVLGQIDALELTSTAAAFPLRWPTPVVGASGSDSNRVPVGALRTYAQITTTPANYSAWVDAIRAGRCFVTNGPLLDWHIAEQQLYVQARSVVPFDTLEVLADGARLGLMTAADGLARLCVPLPEHGLLQIRCRGQQPSPLDEQTPVFAVTTPLTVGSVALTQPPLADQLERVRTWVTTTGQYEHEVFRTQVLSAIAQAQAKLRGEA